MKDIDTYTTDGVDWDIVLEANHDGDVDTAVWFIDDGTDYPRLWFEYVAPAGGISIPVVMHHLSMMRQ
jgi:hypothetical protein